MIPHLAAVRAAVIKAVPNFPNGIHVFLHGENRCKFCHEHRIVTSVDRKLIAEDKKSGGSSHQVTVIEVNITGGFCESNPLRKITLADVLRAIGSRSKGTSYFVDSDGCFHEWFAPKGRLDLRSVAIWNLQADDLSQQSPDLLAFLHGLLV